MRRIVLCLAAVLSALVLSACQEHGIRRVDGRIEVRLWHSMGGVNGDALQRIVDGFNAAQGTYEVRAIFQGGYPESLKKLVSSFGTASMPTMIQLDDIELQFMVDSEATVPVQDFIDLDAIAGDAAHGYPPPVDLADFEPRALDYYTLNGKLQAMPFNLSGPVLYYDKDVFREVGLDPERPPATLDEVRAYSERILKRNPDGSIARHGIALNISAWYFEQMLAKQGALYANNGNGREGRATEVLFGGPEGEAILAWWKEMVDSGLAVNVGRQGLQALLSILSGKAAMAIESTATMRAILLALGPQGSSRFGAGPLPSFPGEGGGMVLGGAAIWIMKDRPEAEQRGAWEFLKYATMPHIQARWHADTGYFPVRLSAWDMEPAASLHRDFPQFTIARNQVLASPRNVVTAGAVLGPFTQVRESVEEAFEQVLVGGKTPREALDRATEEANRAITRYNRSVE
jgi:sn-glycerol 3-phosphate transport system substrate-binding protein